MVESTPSDDPFERAARKELRAKRRAEAARTSDDDTEAPGMLGITATWAVILGLHGWLSGTDGRLFHAHVIVFVLWAALTVGATVNAIAARFLRRR